jgi:hypothetical protein
MTSRSFECEVFLRDGDGLGRGGLRELADRINRPDTMTARRHLRWVKDLLRSVAHGLHVEQEVSVDTIKVIGFGHGADHSANQLPFRCTGVAQGAHGVGDREDISPIDTLDGDLTSEDLSTEDTSFVFGGGYHVRQGFFGDTEEEE